VETILVDKYDAVDLCKNTDENATLPYSELNFKYYSNTSFLS